MNTALVLFVMALGGSGVAVLVVVWWCGSADCGVVVLVLVWWCRSLCGGGADRDVVVLVVLWCSSQSPNLISLYFLRYSLMYSLIPYIPLHNLERLANVIYGYSSHYCQCFCTHSG